MCPASNPAGEWIRDGHMTRWNGMKSVCGAALLAALAAACDSTNNPNNGGNQIGQNPDAGQGAPSMMLGMSPRFGNYLVDGAGPTLYLFALDLPACRRPAPPPHL